MLESCQSRSQFQVRDREDAIASTRDARAPQKQNAPLLQAGRFE